MRTIAHVSDLHFGTEDRRVADGLLADLDGTAAAKPSVVAISGDLTQRATAEQFKAARVFLDKLPVPYIVVPGNHDVPLYDLFSRFFRPLGRYKKYITRDLMPTFFDEEMAVIGAATAHGLTIKDGKISHDQLVAICQRVAPHPTHWKILVTHHPFLVPEKVPDRDRVDGADAALPHLEGCGIDVILTGHTHIAHMSEPAFRTEDRKIVCVNSGTSISTRTRGEPNGYNRLVFDGDELAITHRVWNGVRFVDGPIKAYRRGPGRDATFEVAPVSPDLATPHAPRF
jgi:3',5'-cyclic AMP phosphodiesterase CpdA